MPWDAPHRFVSEHRQPALASANLFQRFLDAFVGTSVVKLVIVVGGKKVVQRVLQKLPVSGVAELPADQRRPSPMYVPMTWIGSSWRP
jgi:hypothetical protein